MTRAALALMLALIAGAGNAAAQAAPQTPPTWEQQTSRTWQALHNKILAMAKDTVFPDNKLETRPHADSRTVLDEFRHVTIGLEMTTAQLKGEPFDLRGEAQSRRVETPHARLGRR